jgi:hypothetical protein
VIENLNDNFVNCWTLLTAKPETPEGRALMRRVAEKYHFPVESLVFSPTTEFVTSQNANVMMQHANRKAEQYDEFLTQALARYRAGSPYGEPRQNSPEPAK